LVAQKARLWAIWNATPRLGWGHTTVEGLSRRH